MNKETSTGNTYGWQPSAGWLGDWAENMQSYLSGELLFDDETIRAGKGPLSPSNPELMI